MKNKSFTLGIIIATSLMIMMAGASQATVIPGFQPPTSIIPSPPFSITNLEGKQSNLSDYRGKVVLLKFWEAYCPYCTKEFKSMEHLANRFKGKLVILAVSSISKPEVINKLIQAQSLNLIQFNQAPSKLVSANFKVPSIPTTYILNKSGGIVGTIDRAIDWNSLSVVNFVDGLVNDPSQHPMRSAKAAPRAAGG